jgi:hypothetical protein
LLALEEEGIVGGGVSPHKVVRFDVFISTGGAEPFQSGDEVLGGTDLKHADAAGRTEFATKTETEPGLACLKIGAGGACDRPGEQGVVAVALANLLGGDDRAAIAVGLAKAGTAGNDEMGDGNDNGAGNRPNFDVEP